MLVLLTNDDGVQAEGLQILQRTLHPILDTVVVAPIKEQSATSHALSLNQPLTIRKIDNKIYCVNGTPTDCVMLAVRGILSRKPDIIIAGINHGPNLGDDVTYSGTVAAAFEGTLQGIPSIAISLATFDNYEFTFAAEFCKKLIKFITQNNVLPENTFINVNVPNLPANEIKGIKITRLGKRIYRDAVVKKIDPEGGVQYIISGKEPGWKPGENTDFSAIEEKKISITPLQLDLTNHTAVNLLKNWELQLNS